MTDMPRGETVTISDLCVRRGGRLVLDNVSLAVAPGQMTALIGPNGCGKSTLLKTVSRILRAEAGAVSLGNERTDRLSPRAVAQRMAMLPQSPLTPDGMRVRDLVAQGRHPHRGLIRQWSRDDDAAIARAMAQADVTGLADARVEALSGGQRQRVWIAMTLAQETGILLLDEPTTYLDLAVQIGIMRLLSDLALSGRTVLVVLHELNLAAAFADRIVMMKEGQIACHGSPGEVLTPEALSGVFGLDARVMPDPETGRPVCLPRTGVAA